MPFTLQEVVPWGRTFDEYLAMFALSERELERRILGCADGPASFNSLLTRRGGSIVSVDPIYAFSADQIRARIADTYDTVIEQTRRNREEFVWTTIGSVEELGRLRMGAMEAFLDDYPAGSAGGRYLAASLPELPFADQAFDIAVCSHFLFLYSAHLSLDFHLRSIRELLRVAREVRIFPLLELGAVRSRHLEGTVDALTGLGCAATIEEVPYEFQRGGNRMLRVVNAAGPTVR